MTVSEHSNAQMPEGAIELESERKLRHLGLGFVRRLPPAAAVMAKLVAAGWTRTAGRDDGTLAWSTWAMDRARGDVFDGSVSNVVGAKQPPGTLTRGNETRRWRGGPPRSCARVSARGKRPEIIRRVMRQAKVSYTIDRDVKVYRDNIRDSVQRNGRQATAR